VKRDRKSGVIVRKLTSMPGELHCGGKCQYRRGAGYSAEQLHTSVRPSVYVGDGVKNTSVKAKVKDLPVKAKYVKPVASS